MQRKTDNRFFTTLLTTHYYHTTMQLPIESLNLLMLNVGMANHNADWNWKDVSSPFTRIYLVTGGSAKIRLREQTVSLSPGHLYIIPAHTIHSYECDGPFSHYYLHVYEGFKNETDVFDNYSFPTEVDAAEGDQLLFEEMCRMHPGSRLPDSNPKTYDNTAKFTDFVNSYKALPLSAKMRIRGATLILFSRFMEHAKPKVWTSDPRLAKVLSHIHANICNDISIDSLATVACVSKPYLIRLFKQEVGTPPLQYINRKKIEKAQLLLLTEEKPVMEVAYALGFSDHSYFIRLFRKITGTTPQAYRQQIRQ